MIIGREIGLKMLYLHSMGHFHPENIISNKFLEDLDIGTTNDGSWNVSAFKTAGQFCLWIISGKQKILIRWNLSSSDNTKIHRWDRQPPEWLCSVLR